MRDKNIQNSDGNRAPGIRLIEATTEDNPCFQHFTKEEILEDRPDMPRINYDPFAYAQPDDFVHREIVGRDYTLRAVVEGPEGCMMAESSFIYQRHAFEVTKVTESPTATGTCLIEIVGFERMMQPRIASTCWRKFVRCSPDEPRIRPG